MRKKGYDSLIYPNGEVVKGPLAVLFDEGDYPIAWHHLFFEEAYTEWVGGRFRFPRNPEPVFRELNL